jgi:hypothetical protein
MKKLQNFKLFESSDQKLDIYSVEDYMVEVLDKYKPNIIRYVIGEYWADSVHLDLYDGDCLIENGQFRKRTPSEQAPDGSFLTYDILVEFNNESESNKFGWEGFCDFDLFTSFITDLRNSMNRLEPQNCMIQIGHGFDKHTITLSLVTNQTKK